MAIMAYSSHSFLTLAMVTINDYIQSSLHYHNYFSIITSISSGAYGCILSPGKMSLDIIGYVECHGNIVTNYKVQGITDS